MNIKELKESKSRKIPSSISELKSAAKDPNSVKFIKRYLGTNKDKITAFAISLFNDKEIKTIIHGIDKNFAATISSVDILQTPISELVVRVTSRNTITHYILEVIEDAVGSSELGFIDEQFNRHHPNIVTLQKNITIKFVEYIQQQLQDDITRLDEYKVDVVNED